MLKFVFPVGPIDPIKEIFSVGTVDCMYSYSPMGKNSFSPFAPCTNRPNGKHSLKLAWNLKYSEYEETILIYKKVLSKVMNGQKIGRYNILRRGRGGEAPRPADRKIYKDATWRPAQ